MIMYGTRYVLQFDSEKFGHEYKILIKERDYTGDSENKSLGAAPLLRRDDSDSGISGTSLEMVIQADVDGELTSLYTVDNKLFLVELYKNGVLIWIGYVLPEKYSEPYISVPYDVSVTASDGLGILKNIQYAQTGTRSIFEIIKYCCDQTSLPLGFEISFSLLEKSMSSMESVLHQATLNTGTFNGMTCYEVLEECMTSLDCFITQSENGWLICSLVDVDKGGYIYNNQGAKTGNGKREKMVLGSTGEDCYPLGSLTNEIIPASKVATFIYDYNKRPSFLSNYDFRKGLEGWIAGGKAIYSHSVNDVHFVNLSEKGSVYQQIDVEKTTQVLSIAVNYCSSTTPIYWGGNIPETGSFNITIKLTDGTTTKYLSLEEGWRDAEYSFPRSSTTKKLQMFQRYPFSESDFEKLEITADGFPFSGKLEIKFQDTTNLGNVTNHVTNVVVTHIVSGGIDVETTLVEAASENHGEVKIAFGDTPFAENADLLFNNVLHVKNGGFTSEWMIGEKTDSFLYTLLKSTCSRIGFPRRQLTGVIQGRDLHTFMLLSDKYSDTLFHVTSAALNLLADEMDVTLEQFMPYRELSGETIESARVTGGNTSEYRSSGENETRVYQSGAGVPMRIRDLSPSELKPGSVIEVDRPNVAKSGKATLQELLGFILETGSVWTEEKLKVIKGYILYLGEKIKAGDSDLWAGNFFEDYLDQPVRKSDDVKFNSVTSTDFESKLKGWIIDALGDAEFQKLVLRESFKTADFIPGVLGAGTGMVGTEDFTTGKLTVRNYMEVMALAIAQVFWRGGQDVYSPSGMKVNKVEEYDDYWRCYMETSKGQKNTCTVGAQMRCNKYGDGKKKYYWNLVTSTGENYIDLSKTDRDGVDVPEVGDELAQFGHRTDPNLSWILVISSMPEDAGMTMYAGVDSYTLSGKWAIRVGKAPDGSNRVGIFTKNGEFSDVIEGLEDKVDNIQIGGANLINQFNADGTTAWFPSDSTAKVSVNNGVIRGEYVGIADAHYPRVCNKSVRKIVLDLDSEYTVSFKIRSNKLAEVAYGISDSNSSNRVMPQVHSPVLSENFIEVKNTFKPLKQISSGNIFYIYITLDFGVGKTAWIEVKDVKIEKGNKATDFSYSQSDNEVRAQAIAKAEAELAETKANAYADGIVTEAEQNAINEAQARLDAIKFGTVNLISRKMMLAWNEKNKDIAVWGQDSDGIYLSINPRFLYDSIGGSGSRDDIFENKIKYKSNTQYVFSIEWKAFVAQTTTYDGLMLDVHYTDGTYELLFSTPRIQSTKTRTDFITKKGKTIQKISCTYGTWYVRTLIYSLALYEGNKVLTEIPVATEDLTGQSNVNLVDGGKEVRKVANDDNYSIATLAANGIKPNSIYTVSFGGIEIQSGNTEGYSMGLRDMKKNNWLAGPVIMPNNKKSALLITDNRVLEGDVRLYLYAGKAGSTAGNSVKFSEVMLVEGFTPPSSYSPSPGDVAKEIQDVSDAVTNLSTTITGAFKDGIVDEAEAKAIASNINILNAEKADIDAYYTKLYANAYLTGTAKTNLASAKTAYNTAHANLISSINTAIADGKATAAEKAGVNAKFTAYNTALSTYKTRVGEADKAIQDRIKELAEQDATNKVDGIQIGVRNLFLDSGKEVTNNVYNIKTYYTSIDLVTGGKYTFVLRGTTTGGQQLGMWANSGYGKIVLLKANMNDEVVFAHVTLPTINESYKRKIDFYNYPGSGATANPATIKWACLYEGHIKPPLDWVQAPEDVEQAIQDAIAKTVDVTAPSQVFKYGAGYTGTPTPASIVLTAIPRNFTPTSYQWQYLNGSTWTNISGATSSTYTVSPGNTTFFPSSTNVRTFRCVCNGDEKLSDSFTLAKLADGATGQPGAAGKDAYTVLLGNESHAFAGSTAAALAGSTTCGVTAYKGATQVAATIGTITGLPAGMTASIASNGTTAPVITFTVTTSMKTASGTVNIPVTVDGKMFTKVFSYSIAFKGDTGQPGAAGKGVSSTVITYQASTSGTTAPTGTWSSTIPAVPAGQFLWTRTVINYTSGSPSTLYSVSKIGTNGTNGNNGVGVSSTVITYQASTSGTTAPTGTWSSTIPSVPAGQYLWTKTVINYTSGSPSTIYSVGKIGEQGIPGESINGKMLYKDPEFKLGLNGVTKYSNSAADIKAKLTVERIAKPSDAPTQSGYCLRVTCKATQSPGYGGVVQSIQSRANAVFIQKIIAKIPVGYNINVASNSMGTGYTDTWLTSTAGTGKYTTYLRKVICGATGTFSSGGHVYITGSPAPTESVPLEWYIASMTCYDQTEDGYADVEITTKDSFAAQLGFTNFEALKANALTKGPLIKAGLINADVIDVNTLAGKTVFADKLLSNTAFMNSVKANTLDVGGFTIQDHYIIGGSDFGAGAGSIKITSTDTERSFKAYKDASHYVEMFYRSASDWGLKGVVEGSTILQLGPTSKIGDFTIDSFDGGRWFKSGNEMGLSKKQLFFNLSDRKIYIASHPSESIGGSGIASYFNLGNVTPTLKSTAKCAIYATVPTTRVNDLLGGSHALYADHGDVTVKDGFFRGPIIPGETLISSSTSNIYLTLQQTLVIWYGTSKINMFLPNNAPNGHEVVIHAGTGRKANLGVICSDDAKMNYRGSVYSWIDLTNRNLTLVIRKIGGYWFTTHEEEWTSGFGG